MATVLGEAIKLSAERGLLRGDATIYDRVGFRARLLARFRSWTSAEQFSEPGLDFGDDVDGERRIFAVYRELLRRSGTTDPEDFAVLVSKAFAEAPTPAWQSLGTFHVIDPIDTSKAEMRMMRVLAERAARVIVTLPHETGGADRGNEAYTAAEQSLTGLAEFDFVPEEFGYDVGRPGALRRLESFVFESALSESSSDVGGLKAIAAPRGDCTALLVAARVRELLAEGNSIDEILVVVPAWGEQADLIGETLRSWDIPVPARAGEVRDSPAYAALRLCLDLPGSEWETAALRRLLRNRAMAPNWPKAGGVEDGAGAAAAIRATGLFRNATALRRALKQAVTDAGTCSGSAPATHEHGSAARAALACLDALESLFEGLDVATSWAEHCRRLERVIERLGLGTEPVIDSLLAVMAEAEELHERMEVTDALTWEGFLAELDRLVALARPTAVPSARDGVAVVTSSELAGARAAHVIIADLEEGHFPARGAVSEEHADLSVRREMLSFARVVGSADRSVTFAYPTKDEKGVALNPSAFLDDARRLFDRRAWESVVRRLQRLTPVLLEDLAVAPRERRVRGVARLATAERGSATHDARAELAGLAACPEHRAALQGTAAALRTAHHRNRRRSYGPFDGMLLDREAVKCLSDAFGHDRASFSPSQLETYVTCPHQYFLKHVLRLPPARDSGEFDVDRAEHGELLHRVLDRLHSGLAYDDDSGRSFEDRLSQALEHALREELDGLPLPSSDVERGLRRIHDQFLDALARQYHGQELAYRATIAGTLESRTELRFGTSEGELEAALIGTPPDAVRLIGRIDRVDVRRLGEWTVFRVIDYKTGTVPSAARVNTGREVQLPIYALLVERILSVSGEVLPETTGYWELKKKGYRPVLKCWKFDGKRLVSDGTDWADFKRKFEDYLVRIVAAIRRGEFPVAPQDEDCTRRCDYSIVCRVRQVRRVRKTWETRPRLDEGP